MKAKLKIAIASIFGLLLAATAAYSLGIFAIFSVYSHPSQWGNIYECIESDHGLTTKDPSAMVLNGSFLYPPGLGNFTGQLKDQCLPNGLLAESVCGQNFFSNGTNFPQYAGVVSFNCTSDNVTALGLKCKTNAQGLGYCG